MQIIVKRFCRQESPCWCSIWLAASSALKWKSLAEQISSVTWRGFVESGLKWISLCICAPNFQDRHPLWSKEVLPDIDSQKYCNAIVFSYHSKKPSAVVEYVTVKRRGDRGLTWLHLQRKAAGGPYYAVKGATYLKNFVIVAPGRILQWQWKVFQSPSMAWHLERMISVLL